MKPVGPATDSVTHYNALDFSRVGDNWRVPGEWTMSVYEGRALVTSVTFVLRAD